ncbi:MAG: type II toxin-antitoxin system VapC family toxin [Bifidobacteriaceae bacterium]|nr:type II toxin-antitoxin system VapC family toxin [Bifidobacteriaceae bacterium]
MTALQVRDAPAPMAAELKRRAAVRDLRDFPARRWPTDGLLARVWALRANLTAYDAVYVALAEALGCVLLTHDNRLATAAKRFADCPVDVL